MKYLNKLLSRKFLVSIGSILTVVAQEGMTPMEQGITGAIAVIYVLAEAFVDRAKLVDVAKAVQSGIQTGSEAAK